MELELSPKKQNKIEELKVLEISTQQNNFIKSTIGKIINTAINIGLRFVLPDFLENQVIDIKDNLFTYGLKEGINKSIEDTINTGKGLLGIMSGKFDNVQQIEQVIKKGGLTDSLSKTIDTTVNKIEVKGKISNSIANKIRKGKNVILDNIDSNIEEMLTNQTQAIEELKKNINNWNKSYQEENFQNMEVYYTQLQKNLSKVVPIENVIVEARKIENIHNLIRNNGQKFDISKSDLETAKILV